MKLAHNFPERMFCNSEEFALLFNIWFKKNSQNRAGETKPFVGKSNVTHHLQNLSGSLKKTFAIIISRHANTYNTSETKTLHQPILAQFFIFIPQKTGFLTFSGVIEMKHWARMGLFLPFPLGFCFQETLKENMGLKWIRLNLVD